MGDRFALSTKNGIDSLLGMRGQDMELPKFNETFMPILQTLSNGEVVHHRELIKRVQAQYYSVSA